MKMLKFSADLNELPPGAEFVAAAHAEVKKLSLSISGLCTTLIGAAALSFVVIQLNLTESLVPKVGFAIGIVGFIVARQYERTIARRLADISPLPDAFLAEAVLLSTATPAARAYCEALRGQKREMMLVEFEAMKALVSAAPVDASRAALYG